MFRPSGEIVEIIMDPPETSTVVLQSLGCQPLSGEFPGENIAVIEIFISGILGPSHVGLGLVNCDLPISKLSHITDVLMYVELYSCIV